VGGGKAQWREEVGLGIPLAPIHFWCLVAACSCSELLSAGPTTKTAGAYQAFVPFSSSFLLSFRHARTQHKEGGVPINPTAEPNAGGHSPFPSASCVGYLAQARGEMRVGRRSACSSAPELKQSGAGLSC
jgi:hypothetical protein